VLPKPPQPPSPTEAELGLTESATPDPGTKGVLIVAGIVLATIVGTAVGIASLSPNFLARKLAWIYVETLRNLPLPIQLLFWYFAVFFRQGQAGVENLFGGIYRTNQGIYIPWVEFGSGIWIWFGLGLVGAFATGWLWRSHRRFSFIAMPLALLVAVAIAPTPASWDLPAIVNLEIPGDPETINTVVRGGLALTPEFNALLAGLTFYTAAFIAEIVRGGIQSVTKGQWEAAKSLGIPSRLILWLIIFPQALKTIVPSLTSQFLNLAKNSSLGIVTGYPDFYSLSSTIENQTGQSVEITLLLIVAYLGISLVISVTMSWIERWARMK